MPKLVSFSPSIVSLIVFGLISQLVLNLGKEEGWYVFIGSPQF